MNIITSGLRKDQFNIDYSRKDIKQPLKLKEFWTELVFKIGDHDKEILSFLYGRPIPLNSTTSTKIYEHLKKMNLDYKKKTLLNRLEQLEKWGFITIHKNGTWILQTFDDLILHGNILELIKSANIFNKNSVVRKGRPKKYEVKHRILLILTELNILLTATKIQKEYFLRYKQKIDRNTFVSYLAELKGEDQIEKVVDYETKKYTRTLYQIKK